MNSRVKEMYRTDYNAGWVDIQRMKRIVAEAVEVAVSVCNAALDNFGTAQVNK